eukprot:gene2494-6518_t
MPGADEGAAEGADEGADESGELLAFDAYLVFRQVFADVDDNEDGRLNVAEVLRREPQFRDALPALPARQGGRAQKGGGG